MGTSLRLAVAFLKNSLAAIDLASGKLLWEERYSRGYDEHAAMPVYAEPLLMTMLPFRAGSRLYAIEEKPEGAISLRCVRHSKEMSNDTASSVLVNGFVYGFDLRQSQTSRHRASRGQFKCIALATGDVRWSSDRPGHATIAVADGKLFLFNDVGGLTLVRATPDRYEELARTQVFRGEMCWTAPTLHCGRLYVRSPTQAACLYVGQPEHMDREQREAAQPASTAVKARPQAPVWLIGAEREYPYDAPDLAELARWFVASLLGVLLPAAIAAEAAFWLVGRRWPAAPRTTRWALFWPMVIVLAIAATPMANRMVGPFVFTWPAALFAAHQIAFAAIFWSSRQPDRVAARWIALGGTVLFVVLCLVYYDLCRRLTLGLAWVFLMGFVPSWPVTIPAARRLLHPGHPAADYAWTLLGYSLYFWASAGFLFCRAWLSLSSQQ